MIEQLRLGKCIDLPGGWFFDLARPEEAAGDVEAINLWYPDGDLAATLHGNLALGVDPIKMAVAVAGMLEAALQIAASESSR